MSLRAHLSRLFRSFPALKAAVDDGLDWESSPNDWNPDLPEMIPHPSFIEPDDEREYLLVRVARGVRYIDGLVHEVRWLIDDEGSLLEEESCELIDDAHFSDWYVDYGPQGTFTAWREYVARVQRTGDDYLGFLTIPPPVDPSVEQWDVLVRCDEEILGHTGVVVQAARSADLRRWIDLDDLPKHVRTSLVGVQDDSDWLAGIRNLRQLKAADRAPEGRRGLLDPGTLFHWSNGQWIFTAMIDTEPLTARVSKAAEEWLTAHPEMGT